jgi:hypothetical protein
MMRERTVPAPNLSTSPPSLAFSAAARSQAWIAASGSLDGACPVPLGSRTTSPGINCRAGRPVAMTHRDMLLII